MSWINAALLMRILRRKRLDPRTVQVYVDDPRLRPVPPRYPEFEENPEEDDEEEAGNNDED